jgi:signal transduction histidine kinase
MAEQGKRQSILVVDDEQDIVDSLYDTLVDKYQMYKATSAKEALEILRKHPVDLVISDQRMPETTGVELFAELEKDYPHIGKVLLTGYAELNSVVDAINKGHVDKYISKPWEEDDIIHIVLEVLNTRLKKAIEERKKLEGQLVQNAKMASLGELVAGIAHEINNPLGFIYANLGNLHKFFQKIIGLIEGFDQLDAPEAVKGAMAEKKEEINYVYLKGRVLEMIERSKVGAERMKTIIQDMKTFSRLDASKVEDADINKAIDTTLNILVHEHKNRIEIKKDYAQLPPVTCNIAKLNQVFMNMLVNACHAIKEKGEIGIKTSVEDGMCVMQFSDSGEGIPDDVVEHIFDPFFTTKPPGKGTGLGLSISHGIIEQHKGNISVKSKVGAGTTFTVKIPVVANMEELNK